MKLCDILEAKEIYSKMKIYWSGRYHRQYDVGVSHVHVFALEYKHHAW